MEAKKSKSANLERHRWARFLFAFLGATLLLVLALEVKLPRWQSSDLPELSEEIFQDLEMKKEIDREEWVAVAPKRENPPPTANVRAVDLSMLPPEAPTSGMPQLVAQSDADVQAAEDLDAALVDNEAKDTPLSFRVVEELPDGELEISQLCPTPENRGKSRGVVHRQHRRWRRRPQSGAGGASAVGPRGAARAGENASMGTWHASRQPVPDDDSHSGCL